MKQYFRILYMTLLFAPALALAAVPISYEEIIASGAGSTHEESATGREVTVRNAKNGMFGYVVNAEDATSFICRSGDRSLVKRGKAAHATFRGTTEFAVGHDGMTTWNLKNCQRVNAHRAR